MYIRYRDIIPFFGPMIAKGKNGETFLIEDIAGLSKESPHLVRMLLCVEGDSGLSYHHRCHWMLPFVRELPFEGRSSVFEDADYHWLLSEFHRLTQKLEENGMNGEFYRIFDYYSIRPLYSAKGWEKMSDSIYHKMLESFSRGGLEKARKNWKDHCRALASPRLHPGRKKKNGRYFRKLATKQEKVWNTAHSLELGESMVRGRRRRVPDAWMDFVIPIEHSWKKNSKVRKQWMKHLKR